MSGARDPSLATSLCGNLSQLQAGKYEIFHIKLLDGNLGRGRGVV
jgi:hypothetical protein